EITSNGKIDYFITVEQNDDVLTFPGKLNVSPGNWAFDPDDSYKLSILPASNDIIIYNPERDVNNVVFANVWRFAQFGIDYTFDKNNDEQLDVNIIKVKEKFPEFAMQFYIGDYLKSVQPNINDELVFEVKKNSEGPGLIFVRILFNDGSGFERKIGLKSDYENVTIADDNLNEKNLKPESIQIALPLPEPGNDLNNYGIKLKKISFVKGNE
ncbi:MAG: hypothetical protein P8Y81_16380, partial [Ignavibacteriaceae bacterium]